MLVVVLPAYNEADSIETLVARLRAHLEETGEKYRILVVDDGSRDGTGEKLNDLKKIGDLEVITHRINRGLGETIRDGFERAVEICGPDDVVIRMDADDTHDPDHFPAMLEKIRGGWDVVVASRFAAGGREVGVPAFRSVLSRGANVMMKLLFPIPGVSDYACGFRAYRAGFLRACIDVFGNDFIELKGLGFTSTVEKLVKLRLLGARITEIPLVLRYDRKSQESKMSVRITVIGYFILASKQIYPWGPKEKARRAAARRFRDEYNRSRT